MDLKKIVEHEAMRAEALLAGYLGLYAGSIDLADFNAESVRGASPEFKRCVRLIQDLAEVVVVSQAIARNMVNAVDGLAELVRTPKMAPPVRALWGIEDSIHDTALGVVRHLLAVGGAVGLGVWGTIDGSGLAEAGVCLGFTLLMLSYACSLSYTREPDHAVTKGMLALLIGGLVMLLSKGVFLTFLIYSVISAGFFIRDIVGWLSTAKPANRQHCLRDSQVGRFSDDELYDMMNAPGPSLTGYTKYDDDDWDR